MADQAGHERAGAPVIAAGLPCAARRQCDCHARPTRGCSTAASPARRSTSVIPALLRHSRPERPPRPTRLSHKRFGRHRGCRAMVNAPPGSYHFSIARDGRHVVPAGRRSHPRVAVHRHVRTPTPRLRQWRARVYRPSPSPPGDGRHPHAARANRTRRPHPPQWPTEMGRQQHHSPTSFAFGNPRSSLKNCVSRRQFSGNCALLTLSRSMRR